jgi:hypothetical protein
MLVKTIVQSRRNEKCGGIDVHLLDTKPRLLSRIEGRRYSSFSYHASAVMLVRRNRLPGNGVISHLISGIPPSQGFRTLSLGLQVWK